MSVFAVTEFENGAVPDGAGQFEQLHPSEIQFPDTRGDRPTSRWPEVDEISVQSEFGFIEPQEPGHVATLNWMGSHSAFAIRLGP